MKKEEDKNQIATNKQNKHLLCYILLDTHKIELNMFIFSNDFPVNVDATEVNYRLTLYTM